MTGMNFSVAFSCILISSSMALPSFLAETGTPEVLIGYKPTNDKRVVFVAEKSSRLTVSPEEFHENFKESMSTTPLFDTNRDETYDTPMIDVNREEIYDTPMIDVNREKTYDTLMIDVNREETYDTPMIDVNREETYDTTMIDVNREETYDTPMIDVNREETYDTTMIDVNREETYDTPMIDVNREESYDTPLIDVNREETYDAPMIDVNREETYDTTMIDVNREETYDTPMIDVNREETYDTPLIDVNREETYDAPMIDVNREETYDAAIFDVNREETNDIPLLDANPAEPYDTLYLAPNSSMLVKVLLQKKLRFLDMASDAMSKNLSFFKLMHGNGASYTYRDYTGLAAAAAAKQEDGETQLNAGFEAFGAREDEISEVNSDNHNPELQATAKQLSKEEPIVFSSEKQNDYKEKELAVIEKPNTDTSKQLPTYKPPAQLEENVDAASNVNLTKRARFRCYISRSAYFKMVGRIVCGYHLPRIYVSS